MHPHCTHVQKGQIHSLNKQTKEERSREDGGGHAGGGGGEGDGGGGEGGDDQEKTKGEKSPRWLQPQYRQGAGRGTPRGRGCGVTAGEAAPAGPRPAGPTAAPHPPPGSKDPHRRPLRVPQWPPTLGLNHRPAPPPAPPHLGGQQELPLLGLPQLHHAGDGLDGCGGREREAADGPAALAGAGGPRAAAEAARGSRRWGRPAATRGRADTGTRGAPAGRKRRGIRATSRFPLCPRAATAAAAGGTAPGAAAAPLAAPERAAAVTPPLPRLDPPGPSPCPCASPGRKQGRRTWKTPSRRFMAAAARQ